MSEHSGKSRPHDANITTLTGDLARVCAKIRRYLLLAEARPARSCYEVGRLVQEVTQRRARYGDGAVARIAEVLGIHVSVFYKCQQVAASFSPKEYEKLCAKRTPAGLPVFTWSHLEVLAAERDPQRRSTLMHDVEEDNLPVRELREEKRGEAAPQQQATPRCAPTYIRADRSPHPHGHGMGRVVDVPRGVRRVASRDLRRT